MDPGTLWRAYKTDQAATNPAPSPARAVPLLGHFPFLGRSEDRLHRFLRLREAHGDVIRFRAAGLIMHLVSDPELIRLMLVDRNRIYTKKTRGMHFLRLVLGNGLLTATRESWLQNRRIAQPTFHRRRIVDYAQMMADASETLSARWRDGEVVDVHEAMMRITLKIIAQTMLSLDVEDAADEIGKAVSFVIEDVNIRLNSPLALPVSIPSPRNLRFRKEMSVLDRVVMGVIRDRRKSGKRTGDLLDMLMYAEDAETGERMDDVQLRDEVMTIFLAGHETTANALTWAIYLLAKHPDSARRARDEAQSVLGQSKATSEGATTESAEEQVKALPFIERVLKEAMRLYPPAWMIARGAAEDDRLGDFDIPKGSMILLSPWVVHRHPDHWDNPLGFDPDRFLPERSAERHRNAYFPFGGGPRLCIGNNFAMMEAKLILGTLLRDWRMELIPGDQVSLDPVITLRPKGGLRVRTLAASNSFS